MKSKKTVTILGSTGSVGKQALDVIRKFPDRFKVVGLSAFNNTDLLREQIDEFKPDYYFCKEGTIEVQRSIFDFMIDEEPQDKKSMGSLEELASVDSDIVLLCVSGIAGLLPAMTTLKRGATLAIANKEAIVAGGRHLKAAEAKFGGKIIPVDSEHNAIFNCIGNEIADVKSIVLTCSGGAFRDYSAARLAKITPEEALSHPNWKMGKKITVDCATLFNKGLEIIEAMHLFQVTAGKVKVVQHKESIVHSLVEFNDNSMKAVLGVPDMRMAIENALFYPEVGGEVIEPLDLIKIGQLNFSEPNYELFPCLEIGRKAGIMGDGASIAVSAADEIIVDSFLKGKIKFTDIPNKLEKVLYKFENIQKISFDDILALDGEARKFTYSLGV
ncbi:MAG: 1-deoxy-D-xylulose-5-phosphate reductoisomerase [Clostridia bacterium]|nr:1-deoxy-D-xylulose-5-phosphate reductoisomerase [Clostridia bacterium]